MVLDFFHQQYVASLLPPSVVGQDSWLELSRFHSGNSCRIHNTLYQSGTTTIPSMIFTYIWLRLDDKCRCVIVVYLHAIHGLLGACDMPMFLARFYTLNVGVKSYHLPSRKPTAKAESPWSCSLMVGRWTIFPFGFELFSWVVLLMAEILHQLIGCLSHLQGLYIPGGAGFLPSTVVDRICNNQLVDQGQKTRGFLGAVGSLSRVAGVFAAHVRAAHLAGAWNFSVGHSCAIALLLCHSTYLPRVAATRGII